MAKKVKLGDILQVLTSQGVAYAQVTHKHPEFGFLILVFPGFHNEQPKDFSVVVDGEPQFSAFFYCSKCGKSRPSIRCGKCPGSRKVTSVSYVPFQEWRAGRLYLAVERKRSTSAGERD